MSSNHWPLSLQPYSNPGGSHANGASNLHIWEKLKRCFRCRGQAHDQSEAAQEFEAASDRLAERSRKFSTMLREHAEVIDRYQALVQAMRDENGPRARAKKRSGQ